ncbi:MAG: HK97 gp10 family phage protein [Alphaproteobacteria bacterium]|nr:HK97 gp10 family phage protein [Alphaproteobacteria bacterium]
MSFISASINASAVARRLTAKLEKIGSNVENPIKAVMAQQADQIVAMQRSLAPVLKHADKRRRAGALRESIGWTWGEPKHAVIFRSRASKLKVGGSLATITIYAGNAEAFYARWIEFGTKASTKGDVSRVPYMRKRRKKAYTVDENGRFVKAAPEYYQTTRTRRAYRTHPGTPKQPFFYPVWRAKRKEVRTAIHAAMRRAIKNSTL